MTSHSCFVCSSDDPLVKVNQAFLCNGHRIAFIPKILWRDGLAGSGSFYMRKSVFVLAVIGAACSSVAFAGEVKQTKTVAPVVKATTMSDSDMDKVTAGFSVNQQLDPTRALRKTSATVIATESALPVFSSMMLPDREAN
jgi:hypothetical protein